MSLVAIALQKLSDLEGKTLAEIVEYCEQNPQIESVCFSSRAALFALFGHLSKPQKHKMIDLLNCREDIRSSEDCERFIKNLFQGISWNYTVQAAYDPEHEEDTPYLILPEAHDDSEFPIPVDIKGLLPASGTIGVSFNCTVNLSFYENRYKTEQSYDFYRCAFPDPRKKEGDSLYFDFRVNAIIAILHESFDRCEDMPFWDFKVTKILISYFHVPWFDKSTLELDVDEIDFLSDFEKIAVLLAKEPSLSFAKTGINGDPPEFLIHFFLNANSETNKNYVEVLIAPKPIIMN